MSKITEKYKHEVAFTKTFDIIKKLKELYNKIVEKLFGDKNAKKDHQDILNAITELQERPTKQQLEAKNKELNTLKQEKRQPNQSTTKNKPQKQKKAQERIQTLESNENTLKSDLNDKESIIQDKDKTITTLKKEIQELEYNYRQDRERMVAENKRLKEQGLEKSTLKKTTSS
ncbi:hypothetical protein JT140_07915 [Helicobacter pylori]|nr:hypothetical protein [Helicobacter pylori]